MNYGELKEGKMYYCIDNEETPNEWICIITRKNDKRVYCDDVVDIKGGQFDMDYSYYKEAIDSKMVIFHKEVSIETYPEYWL